MFKILKSFRKERKVNQSQDEFTKLWNMNIDEIWEIENMNSFVIAMNSWILRKCNYGEDMENLSPQERIFFIVQQLETEVNNGGFSQYFYNCSGNFSHELFNSFITIGAEKTANICKKVVESFGSEIPSNRTERDSFLDEIINDEIEAVLSECDSEFFKYLDNLEELNYKFIIENKIYFN